MTYWEAVERLIKLGYTFRDADLITRIHFHQQKYAQLVKLIEFFEEEDKKVKGGG